MVSLRWGCDAKMRTFTQHLVNIWLIFALIEGVQRCCTLCVTALLMINSSALRLSVLFTQPHNRRFMWWWLILHYSDFSLSTGGSPLRIYRSGGEALPVIYLHRLHPACLFHFYVYPPWHLLKTVHKGTINRGEMLCNKEKRKECQ